MTKQAYEARRAEYRKAHPKAEEAPKPTKQKRLPGKIRPPNAASLRNPAGVDLHPGRTTSFKKLARIYRADPSRIYAEPDPQTPVGLRALRRHGWYRRQEAKNAAAADSSAMNVSQIAAIEPRPETVDRFDGIGLVGAAEVPAAITQTILRP